jgi:hypothetical protein
VFSLYFQRNLLYKQAPELAWIVTSGSGLLILWVCCFPDTSYCQNPLTFWWKTDNNVYITNSRESSTAPFLRAFYMHRFVNMPGFFIYKMFLVRITATTPPAANYWMTRWQVLGQSPSIDYLYNNSPTELVFLATLHSQGNRSSEKWHSWFNVTLPAVAQLGSNTRFHPLGHTDTRDPCWGLPDRVDGQITFDQSPEWKQSIRRKSFKFWAWLYLLPAYKKTDFIF